MVKRVWSVTAISALVAVAFLAGSWITWTTSGKGRSEAGRKVLYWVDPMHPSYKSDKPGIAPDCGMQLEPVYADEGGQPMVPGGIKVSDEKQQLIGVRIGTVETQEIKRTIRTVGRVTADENRLYRVLAASEGIVRTLSDKSSTGSLVARNEVLLTYFARDYVRPQQLYFAALDYLDAAVKGGAAPPRLAQVRGQVRVAIDELINFGMSETQIVELGKTRKMTADIELRSPVSGYVVARNVSPNQRLERGVELFTIADVRKVWILVDLFENESRNLRPGTKVRVSQPYARSRPFEARVSGALPQFDADSRTMKVRLEADNADYSLRPGMFVDAELPLPLPAAVTVPVDAVVDSGVRQIVFVDRGNGYFEPRPVETGWRAGDRVEITRGLSPGERVVLSGTFLLDSESRMKAAAMGIAVPARDLVCGMDVDQTKTKAAGRTVTYGGETYYFCSDLCKKKFEASPASFVAPDRGASAAAGSDLGPDHYDVVRRQAAALRPVDAPGLETVLGGAADDANATRTAVTNVPVVMQLGQYSALAESDTAAVMMDAACGTVVLREDAEKAGLKSEHDGVAYFFASPECKKTFDANPHRYVLAAADARRAVAAALSASHTRDADIVPADSATTVVPSRAPSGASPGSGPIGGESAGTVGAPAKPVVDPVCGMEVDVKDATAAGWKSDHEGATYYFCSKRCKESFDREPARYLAGKK
jgi:YHS domain-containing protein/multidrug efflux pump subunit AcrA (membrane-fusion protein)